MLASKTWDNVTIPHHCSAARLNRSSTFDLNSPKAADKCFQLLDTEKRLRKSSLEVALTSLAQRPWNLDKHTYYLLLIYIFKFCGLLSVSQLAMRLIGFPISLLFSAEKKKHFLLWPWNLAYDLDWQRDSMNKHATYLDHPNTHTHTRPIALHGH